MPQMFLKVINYKWQHSEYWGKKKKKNHALKSIYTFKK